MIGTGIPQTAHLKLENTLTPASGAVTHHSSLFSWSYQVYPYDPRAKTPGLQPQESIWPGSMSSLQMAKYSPEFKWKAGVVPRPP